MEQHCCDMKINQPQEIHLFVEFADGRQLQRQVLAAAAASGEDAARSQSAPLLPPGAGAHPGRSVAVPPRPTLLSLRNGELPELAKGLPATAPDGFVVEPILNRRGQARLLLLSPPGRRVRVNGCLAPRVIFLAEKDFVQFSPDTAVHVTVYNRPHLGPPAPAMLGQECQLCRVPFSPEATCYLCACGTALHREKGDDELQCAKTRSDCPSCGRPIVLQEGFTYIPESHA